MRNAKRMAIVALAILALTNASLLPIFAADTLSPSDFKLESWSKTIDFLDYARAYAQANGKTPPSETSHAYLYLTYVNTKGMQMMYGGLTNITDGTRTVTLPIQSWMMHYKSRNESKDLVTAGSFIMLLAFGENETTIYPDSPDRNDTLFASFNIGFDLTAIFGNETPPGLSSKTTVIPLTSKNNKTEWNWGMKYSNLTAIWWQTSLSKPKADLIAVTRYDELTFTYDLKLDPDNGTATLTASYTIGKITDLWLFGLGWFSLIIPGVSSVHYNSTGCYWLNGQVKLPDQGNVYEFLWQRGIKMSIVQFQSTVILDSTAYFSSGDTSINNSTETSITDSSVVTTAADGEQIFDADFATKKTYNLYNYTADPTEHQFATYNTTTRTAKLRGFADNPIFRLHTGLMGYIPLILANIDSALYQKAKDHLLDLSYADYFYIISYPTYSGYRIEHDPTYTAYYNAATATPPNLAGAVILIIIIAAALGTAVLLLRRRRTKPAANPQVTNTPASPPPPPLP